MDRLGIQSLNAGASDLRLSGDQTQRGGTYTQRRRAQMAGGGITNLQNRPGYWWGGDVWDWTKEKVADIIPNEIKDPIAKIIPNELKNPVVAAVAANYLPKILPGGSDQTLIQQAIEKGINPMNLVGDNEPLDIEGFRTPEITIRKPVSGETSWSIGDTLGNLVGGAGNVAKKIGQTIIPGGETGYGNIYGGLGTLAGGAGEVLGGAGDVAKKALATILPFGDPGYVEGGLYKTAGQALMSPVNAAEQAIRSITTGKDVTGRDIHPENIDTSKDLGFWREALATVLPGGDPGFVPGGLYKTGLGALGSGLSEAFRVAKEGERGNIIGPLLGGLAAGKYQSDWLKDQPAFPADETGIKFQTAAEAMADPKQRFKLDPRFANVAEGGRIGYSLGKSVEKQKDVMISFSEYKSGGGKKDFINWYNDVYAADEMAKIPQTYMASEEPWQPTGWAPASEVLSPDAIKIGKMAQGGRIGAQEGGLMDLGGMEKDYRQEGGFVPIGGQEKADDVPARLSKNEFVFTADAVRSAGGGDIDAGAEVMERLMENLEAGGKVSEESQGLEGAQEMFANTQRLQNRII